MLLKKVRSKYKEDVVDTLYSQMLQFQFNLLEILSYISIHSLIQHETVFVI